MRYGLKECLWCKKLFLAPDTKGKAEDICPSCTFGAGRVERKIGLIEDSKKENIHLIMHS